MSTLRVLEPWEYESVLSSIADGFVPLRDSVAIVAEEDGRTVGRIFLLAPVHLEGPWVEDMKRGSLLGHRLLSRAENEARSRKIKTLFAYAADGKIERYLEGEGYERVPMTVWRKQVC